MSTNIVSSRMTTIAAFAVALLAHPLTADAGVNSIRSVDSRETGGATQILIRGSSTPTFTVYKLDRPARVVVDISSSALARGLDRGGDGKVVWHVNSWAVGDISAHELGGGAVTRVVVGMARPGTYSVKAVGNDVAIVVTPRDKAPVAASGADPKEVARARADARDAAARTRAAQENAAQANASADQAKANAAAAKASAARARARERKARADAAAARKSADDARADAAREIQAAKAEAARARAELAAAKQRADEQVASARADADKTIADAKRRARQADRAMAVAADKMKQADRSLREASELRTRALAIEKKAQAAMATAEAAEKRAADAEKSAGERRAEAMRAAKAAARYRKLAESAAGDTEKSAALRKQAESAAKKAEERLARAERAAAEAERRRATAEAAARDAAQRKSNAERAVAEAEAERQQAEASRAGAESARQHAIAERRAADKRRSMAQAAAEEAAKRAASATSLRSKEEAAYARAAAARKQAEARRAAAEEAARELERQIAAAEKAKKNAAGRRAAVAAAERKADDQRKRGATQEARKTDAEVARLRQLLTSAERELAARDRAVAAKRQEADALDRKRDAATAELEGLRTAARSARTARQGEESRLADLLEKRAAEERQLAAVRIARKEAEAKASAAEERARDAQAKADQARARAAAAEKRAAAAARTIAAAKADARAAAKRVRVRDVSFDDTAGAARVTIGLSAPAKPVVVQSTGTRRVLELSDATIARKLERTLDTRKYRGPVRAVSSYRSRKDPTKVRIVVDLASSAPSKLVRVGNDYHWEFGKPAVAQARPAPARKARTSRIPAPVLGGYGSSSTPIAQQTVAQVSGSQRKVYRGTKIDLDFKDADIHNLLRLLADVGGVNIVIPDEIKYRVTVRMRRVPWDQALEVILASKGLWYQRNGNLYRIAPRKELDAEAQAEAERRAALVQAETPKPDYITLNYSNAKDVQAQASKMLSPKGQMQVDARTNTIVVIDVKANRQNIANLLARLDTPTPQIQVEARIVEARSTFLREIGVQWGGSANASAAGGNATGLIFPNSVRVAGGNEDNQTNAGGVAAPSDFAVNLPAAVGTGAGGALGFSLGSVGGNFNLNLRLSALEDQGTVRIVSAPKATVINNVKAKIISGVSIPVSVVSANGTQTQFVPADLSLEVTPTVSQRDCAITLELKVAKNEADFVNTGARGDPTILRKEVETRVLVADGATTVIGGIYTRNTGLSYSKVPFFGDLPVFGWFFKSRRENDERTEFLVFITPKITNKAALRCE